MTGKSRREKRGGGGVRGRARRGVKGEKERNVEDKRKRRMRRRRQPRDERKKAQGQERGDGQSLSVKRNVGGMRTRIGVRELMGEGQNISAWGGKRGHGVQCQMVANPWGAKDIKKLLEKKEIVKNASKRKKREKKNNEEKKL